jgi:hypothetical protein
MPPTGAPSSTTCTSTPSAAAESNVSVIGFEVKVYPPMRMRSLAAPSRSLVTPAASGKTNVVADTS